MGPSALRPSDKEDQTDAAFPPFSERAMELTGVGAWEWDVGTGRVRWSDSMEAMHGLQPGAFGGRFDEAALCLHPDDADSVIETMEHRVAGQEPFDLDYRVVRPDGEVRWMHTRGRMLLDDRGHVERVVGVAVDITGRKQRDTEWEALLAQERAARAAAEVTVQRLEYLARVGGELGMFLDLGRTLEHAVRLVVPDLADWCVVYLADKEEIRPQAVHHMDEGRVAVLRRLVDAHRPLLDDDWGAARAMRGQEPFIAPEPARPLIGHDPPSPGDLRALRSIGAHSTLVVPLVARGKPLGAVVIGSAQAGRPFDDSDLQLATTIGQRMAAAIDNALIFEQRNVVAETLQRSLIPPVVPTIPGIDLGARYRAAGAGIEMGGDFFDVFPVRDDLWGVAIGDVSGKGVAAASATGLARYALRAAVVMIDDPAEAMAMVNDTMIGAGEPGSFCTMAYASLLPHREGATVELVVAGHPLPLLIRPDGTVTEVGSSGPLLGAFPDQAHHVGRLELRLGDTLLFFTDGAFEARAGDDFFGEARLRSELASLRGIAAAEVVLAIERAILEFQPALADDLALLAVRIAQ